MTPFKGTNRITSPYGWRTWGNTYDHNTSQWHGWRGTQM